MSSFNVLLLNQVASFQQSVAIMSLQFIFGKEKETKRSFILQQRVKH